VQYTTTISKFTFDPLIVMVESAVLNCGNYDKMYTYADKQLIYLTYTLNIQNTSFYYNIYF